MDALKAFEADCEVVEAMIREQGELSAQFNILARDAIVPVMAPDYGESDETRLRARQLVKILCIAHDALAVTFIMEAWMAEEWVGRETGLRPADREDKREVVVLHQEYRQGDEVLQRVCSREILRGDDGSVSGLGPDRYAGGGGRWGFRPLRLLPPEMMRHPLARQAAKSALARVGSKL